MEVDSDEEDEEEAQSAQPYLSLMRSLVESAPKAKRRKLDHASAEEQGPDSAKPETAPEVIGGKEDEEERDVDFVEEPEEDPTNAGPEDLFDEDDDLDISDPFELHFADPKEEVLRPRLEAIQGNKWRMKRIAANSTRIFFNTPDAGDAAAKPLPAPVSGISDLKLKKRLQEAMAPKHPKFDQIEQTVAPLLFNYQDVLYCNRTVAGSQGIRRMASLHALNHVFKWVT